MKTPTKPKAVLVEDKGWQDKYAYRIADFRKKLGELKDETGYVKGLGSYALYAIDHRRGQLVVLASEPTSADFAPYITARALGDVCSRYDHIVEYRDPGSSAKPKITIRVWELAQ
jgi:hypothetical protein